MDQPTDHCVICGVKLGTKHKTYCVKAAERAAEKSSGGE